MIEIPREAAFVACGNIIIPADFFVLFGHLEPRAAAGG